ncbi:hypothetical protein Q8F57_030880 [Paraburkholderia terrae]
MQVVVTGERLNGPEAILINETNRTQTLQVEIARLREGAVNVARARRAPNSDVASNALLYKVPFARAQRSTRPAHIADGQYRDDKVLALNAKGAMYYRKTFAHPDALAATHPTEE